jgi:hypothetical protein
MMLSLRVLPLPHAHIAASGAIAPQVDALVLSMIVMGRLGVNQLCFGWRFVLLEVFIKGPLAPHCTNGLVRKN